MGELSFSMLMHAKQPSGTLLMDFMYSDAGFCLAIQPEPVGKRRALPEPRFFFLEAAHYFHYLTDAPAEECDKNRLFEELSRRCQTRDDAISLIAEMPLMPPLQIVSDELMCLQLASLAEREAAEENLRLI